MAKKSSHLQNTFGLDSAISAKGFNIIAQAQTPVHPCPML
jgi:hypothetical protein